MDSEKRQLFAINPANGILDSCFPEFDKIFQAYKATIITRLSHLPGGEAACIDFVSFFEAQSHSARYQDFFTRYEAANCPNIEFG